VQGGRVYHRAKEPEPRRRWRALAGALVLLAPAAALRAQEVESSLRHRLTSIESAFRQADAGALRSSFPRQGKVRVHLPELARGPGAYGAGQLQVLFERLFRDHGTQSFSFPAWEVRVSAEGVAFARAHWVRAPSAVEDVLTFTLRQESGDWRVHEVLSSR
jgi:hypothetical protein